MFSELQEVRSLARARAQEDLAYFALYVQGLRLSPVRLEAIQYDHEHGIPQGELSLMEQKALNAWVCLVSCRDTLPGGTETFQWLFAERAA